MAKSRKQNPRKAGGHPSRPGVPPRQIRRVKSGGISSWYLWVIVGVLILAGLFMLAQILSTTPPRDVILPVLESHGRDLETLTRMAGDIELDSGPVADLPDETRKLFQPIDSLISLELWDEAREKLRRIPRPVEGEPAAILDEYTGYCYYRSLRPDHALHFFRQATVADSAADSTRQFRLAFAGGYLFQSHGYPDSALAAYATAQQFLSEGLSDSILPILYNNIALAYEMNGDTARALEFYHPAADFIESTEDSRLALVLRDNLRRMEQRKTEPAAEPEPES